MNVAKSEKLNTFSGGKAKLEAYFVLKPLTGFWQGIGNLTSLFVWLSSPFSSKSFQIITVEGVYNRTGVFCIMFWAPVAGQYKGSIALA